MGLILKHVSRTSHGTFTYWRRVPKAVSAIITKREFKQKLGDSERELTTLSALINFAAREFDLPGTFRNPFSGLRSTGKGSEATASSRGKRDPLPPDVLKAARASLMHGAAPQLVLIWRLLQGQAAVWQKSQGCGSRMWMLSGTSDQAGTVSRISASNPMTCDA